MVFDPKQFAELTETEPETYQGSASPHNVMVKHINQVLAAEHKHMLEFQAEQRQLLAEKQARHERERAALRHQAPDIPIISTPTNTEDADMNLKPFASAAIVAASLLTAGCGDAKGPPATAKTELYKRNPNPKQGYEITARIHNPPGPLNKVDAGVRYQTKGCFYVLNSFEGVNASPEQEIELPVTKIGDNEYSIKVYLDEMIDEDYYGNGVCRWWMTGAAIGFMATGAKDETAFSADVSYKDFPVTQPITYYFWSKMYPRASFAPVGHEGGSYSGTTKLNDIPTENRNEYFTITIDVKPIHP